MNNLQESVYDNVQLGNRMSSRRRFFQNLNHEEASGVSITFGNNDGNTSDQMDEPMSNLGRSANHNMHLGSRKSLRNIYFQQLDNEGTVGTSETFESEQNDNCLHLVKHTIKDRNKVLLLSTKISEIIHFNVFIAVRIIGEMKRTHMESTLVVVSKDK
uniref:uncharacterized protein LOC105351114 n=1 Tax=Fragaria vesca subsp. vesca TaxID=101020 RepID=UPI0005CA79BA|nr:PREDICTED: uncharacterized protein LOC105351114 [Fragaria vesca subsp. vesca]